MEPSCWITLTGSCSKMCMWDCRCVCVCDHCYFQWEGACTHTHTHTRAYISTICKCQRCVPGQRVVINSINSIDERTVTVQDYWAPTSNLNLFSIFSFFLLCTALKFVCTIEEKHRFTLQREKYQQLTKASEMRLEENNRERTLTGLGALWLSYDSDYFYMHFSDQICPGFQLNI